MKKFIALISTGIVLGATLAGCGTAVPPDNMALKYKGGAVEGAAFEECVAPSKVADMTINDSHVYFPTSERTWNIAEKNGDDNTPVISSSKQNEAGQAGPQVKVWVKTDFFLNTYCNPDDEKNSPIVKWWETLGRRYGADVDPNESPEDQSKDKGWRNMLNNSLVPIVRSTIMRSTKSYTADDLDVDLNGSWDSLKSKVEEALAKELNANGKFFCGRGYNRETNVCPEVTVLITGVDYVDSNVAVARSKVLIATQEAAAALIQAKSKVAVANELAKANRNADFLEFQKLETQEEIARMQLEAAKECAKNPNCTLIQGSPSGVLTGTK